MDIIITQLLQSDGCTYLTATSGKISGFVSLTGQGVRVCCHNAAHRAWRTGAGKLFPTIAEAVAGYKSPDMKAIIRSAGEAHAPTDQLASRANV
jgi:hypothetical protein